MSQAERQLQMVEKALQEALELLRETRKMLEGQLVVDPKELYGVAQGPWLLKSDMQWCKPTEFMWLMSKDDAKKKAKQHKGKIISLIEAARLEDWRMADQTTKKLAAVPTQYYLSQVAQGQIA